VPAFTDSEDGAWDRGAEINRMARPRGTAKPQTSLRSFSLDPFNHFWRKRCCNRRSWGNPDHRRRRAAQTGAQAVSDRTVELAGAVPPAPEERTFRLKRYHYGVRILPGGRCIGAGLSGSPYSEGPSSWGQVRALRLKGGRFRPKFFVERPPSACPIMWRGACLKRLGKGYKKPRA